MFSSTMPSVLSNQVVEDKPCPMDQDTFAKKYNLFLESLDKKENLPEWAMRGLCNGFITMVFRDDLVTDGKSFLSKIYNFVQYSDEKINTLAKLYSAYDKTHRKLIQQALPLLNQQLALYPKDKMLQEKIRKKHYENIAKLSLLNFDEESRKTLQFLMDLYFTVNSLLFVHSPGRCYSLRIDDKMLSQNDFIALASFIAADDWIKNGKVSVPVVKAFSFVFNFNENELITFLKQTIFQGDFVRISSQNHFMYFRKTAAGFYFYNPNNDDGRKFYGTEEQLSLAIKNGFFTEYHHDSSHMLLGMHVFEKKDQQPQRMEPEEIYKNLMKKRANDKELNARTFDGATALWMAADNENLPIVKCLLEDGADPNVPRNTGCVALHLAIEKNYSAIAELLIEHGAEVNIGKKTGETPLFLAIYHQYFAIAQLLLENGANANETLAKPLLWRCAKKGFAEMATSLLMHGALINMPAATDQSTPLYIAAAQGHKKLVRLLLNNGADVDKVTSKGYSPLAIAAQSGFTSIVALLIEKNANINLATCENKTPLYLAASQGYLDIVKILLARHAEVNTLTQYHISPLHVAIMRGYRDIVKVLIKAGANLNEKDETGLTPLALALQQKNYEMLLVILTTMIQCHQSIPSALRLLNKEERQHLIHAYKPYIKKLTNGEEISAAKQALMQFFTLAKHPSSFFVKNNDAHKSTRTFNPLQKMLSMRI